MRFPTTPHVANIPQPLLGEAETIYQQALATGCEAARDRGAFFRATAEVAAFWTLECLSRLLLGALEQERQLGISTNRQRIMVRLAAFVQVAARADHLLELSGCLSQLAE